MSAHPVSNFPEAEFRFSRADRRCSCSSSTRRYSCSNKRLPRSRSRCCSNAPTRGSMGFSTFLRITSGVDVLRYTLRRGGETAFQAASAPRFSKYVFFVLDFSEEAEPTADVRARVRRGANRARSSDSRVRARVAVRTPQHAAFTTTC